MALHRGPKRQWTVVGLSAALALIAGASVAFHPALAATTVDQLGVAQANLANCQLLAAHSSGTQHDRAVACIADQTAIIAQLTPSRPPTPSATATTTSMPTTAPPTTTPPKTTPPPTSPAPGRTGCLVTPSACGYPDATNTGVPAGTALTPYSGDYHANTPGAVISNLDINGCLYVGASNVTVKNSRIGNSSCWYTVRNGVVGAEGSWSGLRIIDSDIRMAPLPGAYGISYNGYRLTRVKFVNLSGLAGADCAYFGHDVTIEDTYCQNGLYTKANDATAPHFDGFSSSGGANIVLRHNTVLNPNPQNSAILLSTNDGAISNVVIDNNLVDGGGYTAYCGTSTGGVAGNVTLTNNRFGPDHRWGPVTACNAIAVNFGNIDDTTGAPIAMK